MDTQKLTLSQLKEISKTNPFVAQVLASFDTLSRRQRQKAIQVARCILQTQIA